jgi:ribonuclease HI
VSAAGTPRFQLRTDGGARGNPGPAGAGFVLVGPDGIIVAEAGRYIGETTNNVAEYEALLWGLETAADAGVTALDVFCDSELVVKQMTGAYRVKHENMKPLFARATGLVRRVGAVRFHHVPRCENAAADAMVNAAIDARGLVGDAADLAAASDAQARLFDPDSGEE